MKIYAIIQKYGTKYAAHIDERRIRVLEAGGHIVKQITKTAYRATRADGLPSWGEYELGR